MGNGIQPTSTKYSNYSRKLANCGVQIISSLHFSESTDTLVADFNPHQFHPVSSSTGPTGKRPSRNGLLTTLKVSVKADNSNSSSPVACGVASTGLEIPSKDEAKDEPAKWTMKVKVC